MKTNKDRDAVTRLVAIVVRGCDGVLPDGTPYVEIGMDREALVEVAMAAKRGAAAMVERIAELEADARIGAIARKAYVGREIDDDVTQAVIGALQAEEVRR